MDWDDPMLRDLAQLGPASVGRARDGPGPLNPVAVIRALRAQRDPREAQPAPEERRRQSPMRRARRSSRSSRSNSPRESRSKSRSKSPWKTYWNPKEESKTRFLRSTRSAKLERRFPEEAVIWQELSPVSKAQRGENTRGVSSEAGRRPPSASASLSRQDKSPQSRDWETVPPKLPVNWDSTGRRYACHNDLISEPLLGEMLLDAAAKGDVLQVRGILDQAELDQQNVASVLASRDFDDRTPLHWAARQGHLEVCDLLLRKKADALSTSGPPLATPLMLASLHGHAGVVRRLLGTSSASKQLQSCDAKGRNALHLACCSKSQVLQLLLHVQPELLHSQDKLGRNPLYYALGNPVPEEQWEILNTLLLGKCCAHQVDYLDRSPLWYAVHAGAVNSTALMLRLSPDRPPEVATSSKTRHDLERPKPESQPKPEESKAEEKKDKPKPDAKPEEPKAEEKKDEPKPDAKPEEPKAEEKKDEPKPDAKPEEPKAEEKKDEPKPDAKPEEPKAEEKKDEPKPDAKPEEPKAEEKKDEPKPDAKPEEPKAEEKKDEPKPDAKPEEPKTVPALPNVPHVLALETPRSYVDPVPVLKTVTESGSAEATAVAKELQELLEQHKYLNPQTAHVRHPLHGWVSRCSQLLADSKVAEAKVCLARVTTGLNTDMTRISTAFRRFDMDESKHLDETEIMRLAAYLGVDVNPKDLDHNTDGEISLSEFQDFVGRMGGIQQLFEQRRRRVAETRRDTLSMAGVAIGARVLAHFYAGVKPDRYKSPEPEEAVVLGVHYKDDDMAGPSQLEVELEFLRDPTTLERTKKATCVPSHWIVSTSEDAEVAAALREVGIHDEDQPFWDAVFPASETREVVRLTTCQRRALALVRAQATYLHQAAYPRVLERFQKMGYTDKELQAVLSWVQDLAPVIIHVQLDTVGRFLESDEFYRSQFETKTSNGALDDGNNIRIGWEEDLFGDAYHDATPFERCKYGALNVTNDFEGCRSALQYGDSYLVLKDVRLRCSFAATDSGGIEGSRLAVLDKYAHVLEEYHEHEIQGILDVAMAPEPRAAEELPKLMRGSTENSIREWLTFGFPQLKRKEGCFFFEVELKEGCILPHVGLAGDQFMWTVGVKSVTGIGGIGDDEYSCGVDGLHGACLKNGPVSSWNVSWPKGSVERVHFDCDNYEREQSEILGKTVLVGVLVDLDHGTVTFASDGAWGSTWNPHITQEDMPCYHEGLFPAISIKGSASFHFGPDFKHPPPKSFCDFTPWAKLGEVRVDNPAVGCSDVLNIYKEAQIHGEVCLKKHVLRLVANKRYRQQTRSWSIQVTGAGRCNGTYQWFDRFNKRSCYKSPSGCIIYYNQQESCWRINSRQEFTGFVFQAKSKETSRYVSNMGGHSEPPRTGWKPTLGLKGCVPVEIFQKALVQQGVPTEDLEHMIKVLRGSDEEKDSIFRKLGETTFKAEWHRLVWPPHARPLSAAGAWAEVVRLAQSDILTKLGLSTSTAVVVSPQGEPDGTWECLVSLGPREESDSTGVAFHVINLRGGDAEELGLSSPSIAWRHAGPGAKAAAAIPLQGVRGWLGTDDPIPGIVVERGPGTLRRLQLDADALLRKDIFWPLQELGEAAEKPKSMSGRWSSGNGRCALKVDEAGTSGRLWLLRNQTGPQERCLICQYDATERSLTGVAKDEANEAEEMKVSLTMSADALTLTGTLGAQEMSFRRMTDAASFVWGSVNELGNSEISGETSSLKRIVVNYRKGPKACEELQFTLDDRWPFTPIVLEAFKSPSGPAQDAKVRTGWYLDIVETFFYQRSDVFEEMAGDQKYLENLEEAHRQIHSLYDLLLRGLERTPLRLVFVNALEVDQLPEAEIQISGPLREQLGELSETGALTGKGLQRSSPAFLAGVRAGWQVDVERSLRLSSSRLGTAREGPASEDSLKFLLQTSEERVLCFSMDARESLEVQVSTTSCETVQFSGADSVVVRCDTCRTDNAAGRYLLVLSPTGGEYGIPNKDQLQKLAEAWEESCDRLFGLKGEEVSVERDAWDEVRLRALCAHHGWEFSWMTEDDERRRRIAKGCGN